jgi:hypothetical protein
VLGTHYALLFSVFKLKSAENQQLKGIYLDHLIEPSHQSHKFILSQLALETKNYWQIIKKCD